MATKRPRHAITETPPIQAALDELRAAVGGLAGLVDRVTALRGTLIVESPPGGGTRVRAMLPLADER